MAEKWKPVRGYEGRYEVSDFGRVRSVSRLVTTIKRDGSQGVRRISSKILALHTWGAKYPGIVLRDERGMGTRFMVHRLVADAFIENPAKHTQVNHIDADTMNPAASNLEWCSQSENVKHAYAIGNRETGKQHHFSRLPRSAKGFCEAGTA